MEKTEMTLQKAPKVSLIVPMYMCEAYVPELMAMLCGQDMREIEIICVIDGSPDRTRELVEKYAAGDSRIRVIVQDHGGAGKARNTGMAAARGKYLMFPDADDDFQRNYVSAMYRAIEQCSADIVVCRHRQKDFSTQIISSYVGYSLPHIPAGKRINVREIKNLYNVFSHYAHNKIISQELIGKYQLSFSETNSSNDVCFVCGALSCASGVAVIPDQLYTYRMNLNTHSISSNRMRTDYLIAFDDLYQWLHSWDLWNLHMDNFIQGWQKSFHYWAKYGYDEEFVKKVSESLVSTAPWKDMDARSLYRCLRLDTANQELTAELILAFNQIKKILNKSSDGAEYFLTRQRNEIRNVKAVRECLENDYGKKAGYHDNLFRSFIWTVQDAGFTLFVNTIIQRMKTIISVG